MYNSSNIKAIATTGDRIYADQLTENDTVIYQGSRILVISEPEYRYSGIVLDALWLDVSSSDNVQQLTLEPSSLFELVSHSPAPSPQLAA